MKFLLFAIMFIAASSCSSAQISKGTIGDICSDLEKQNTDNVHLLRDFLSQYPIHLPLGLARQAQDGNYFQTASGANWEAIGKYGLKEPSTFIFSVGTPCSEFPDLKSRRQCKYAHRNNLIRLSTSQSGPPGCQTLTLPGDFVLPFAQSKYESICMRALAEGLHIAVAPASYDDVPFIEFIGRKPLEGDGNSYLEVSAKTFVARSDTEIVFKFQNLNLKNEPSSVCSKSVDYGELINRAYGDGSSSDVLYGVDYVTSD